MTKFKTLLSAAVLAISALSFGGGASSAMGLSGHGGSGIANAQAGDALVTKTHFSHRRFRRGHRHVRVFPRWRRHRMERRWRSHRRWDRRIVRRHHRGWRR